ncbi:hypothetical protein FHS23_001580 [Prauserella isguenensis]|uniref:Uncharacterized protein n=1 Tax=Prauserella isguenensis TaxID=1470180 RepID=A0A839RZ96_9PSEU|nr:hypothetical protein [Prauserella isguenensis]MBB3050585.1 hypothetical protein [Prauserella isguenensis]
MTRLDAVRRASNLARSSGLPPPSNSNIVVAAAAATSNRPPAQRPIVRGRNALLRWVDTA